MWDKIRKGRFELVTLPNVSLKKAKGERRSLKHLSVDSRVEENGVREALLAGTFLRDHCLSLSWA